MKKPTYLLRGILIGIAPLLSACSTTSETFDCKEGKGVGCKSIAQVNSMVDQGALGSGEGVDAVILSQPVIVAQSDNKLAEIPLSEEMTVQRIKEEHLRVWIAPFQDEFGNLHEGSVVHTVLKPGYWQMKESL